MPENTLEVILRLQMRGAQRDKAQATALMKEIAQSAERAGVQVRAGMREAESGTRSYIRSAVDLQATMRESERLARQFGDSLRTAAAGTAVQQSFESLARSSGVNADKLLANMKRAAKGTVTELELVRIANRAMLAGGAMFAEELPRLFEIARAASIATGQDIGFVFDTLTRGIAKASPLLIDNAEIYIKVGRAVDQYAESIGKSTDDLSAQERQTATLNAVLAEGSKFVQQVGSDAEAATDQFDRWSAKVRDAKQDVGAFINQLGPVGPLLSTAADLFQSAAPLLTTYILLKNQATIAAERHAAALGVETAALGAQGTRLGLLAGLKGLATGPLGAAAVGVAVGVVGYEKLIRPLDKDLPSAADTAGKAIKLTTTALGYFKTAALEGNAAAREFARAQLGIPTLAERAEAAQEKHAAVIERVLEQYRDSDDVYARYVERVREANDALEDGELALQLLTRAQFEFLHQTDSSTEALLRTGAAFERAFGDLPALGGIMRQFNQELQASRDELQALEETANRNTRAALEQAQITSIVQGALQAAGLDAERLQQKQDTLAVATGQVTAEQVANRKAIELLAQAYALGAITAGEFAALLKQAESGLLDINEQYYRSIVASVEAAATSRKLRQARLDELKVTGKLAQEERQLAASLDLRILQARERAAADRLRAAQELASQLESLARNHAGRVQDIERNHRRRVQDIEREYTSTVRKAAIERDALAILEAREARGEQLDDAERDRRDALNSERRSYDESRRQAYEAYSRRLQEIDAALREEIRRERAAYQAELAQQRAFYGQQLSDLRTQHARLEAEEAAHQARMSGIRSRGQAVGSGPYRRARGRTRGMQFGGAGTITGPATFVVEPGVREAYWFSGALNRGSSPVPGGAMQPAAQRVQVGGRVGVDVTGLGDRLGERLAPQIGQMVVDALAQSFNEAMVT